MGDQAISYALPIVTSPTTPAPTDHGSGDAASAAEPFVSTLANAIGPDPRGGGPNPSASTVDGGGTSGSKPVPGRASGPKSTSSHDSPICTPGSAEQQPAAPAAVLAAAAAAPAPPVPPAAAGETSPEAPALPAVPAAAALPAIAGAPPQAAIALPAQALPVPETSIDVVGAPPPASAKPPTPLPTAVPAATVTAVAVPDPAVTAVAQADARDRPAGRRPAPAAGAPARP